MQRCAIDIHHHYLPPELLEEGKSHGKALGVEVGETKEGQTSLAIAGGSKNVIPPDLAGFERRFAMMEEGKITVAALQANSSSLAYRLDGQRGEAWCNLYNQGVLRRV